MAQTQNYIRLALKPEDLEHLLELVGEVEDPLIYRLKAKWLEWQADQPVAVSTKKLAKR